MKISQAKLTLEIDGTPYEAPLDGVDLHRMCVVIAELTTSGVLEFIECNKDSISEPMLQIQKRVMVFSKNCESFLKKIQKLGLNLKSTMGKDEY